MAGQTSFSGILARLAIALFLGGFVAGIAFRQAWDIRVASLPANNPRPSFGEFVFQFDDDDGMRFVRLGCISAGAFVFAISLISAFRVRDARSAWALVIANLVTILFSLFIAMVISMLDTPILDGQGGH